MEQWNRSIVRCPFCLSNKSTESHLSIRTSIPVYETCRGVEMQPESKRTYLPAAGFDWTLPFYDPIVKLLGGEKARRVLIDQAALQPGHRVLDIGCGTGTMAVLIKRQHPDVEIIGIDPDPKALARARRQAARAGVSIPVRPGVRRRTPIPRGPFRSRHLVIHVPPSAGRGEKQNPSRDSPRPQARRPVSHARLRATR